MKPTMMYSVLMYGELHTACLTRQGAINAFIDWADAKSEKSFWWECARNRGAKVVRVTVERTYQRKGHKPFSSKGKGLSRKS